MGGDGEFAYLSSFPSNFLIPVLHQEIVGAKSDNLLAPDENARQEPHQLLLDFGERLVAGKRE
jgi:hypothetical protein